MNKLTITHIFWTMTLLLIVSCGANVEKKSTTLNVDEAIPNIEDSGPVSSSPIAEIKPQQVSIIEPDTAEPKSHKVKDQDSLHMYNLSVIADRYPLGSDLIEISALSLAKNNSEVIYGVNDEEGLIFKMDKRSGKLLERINFSKNGDYEGIELVNDLIYVLKSNGNLYAYDRKDKSTSVYKTKLSQMNDTEGLGVSLDKKRLLIACKGNPNLKGLDDIKKAKSIYSFDIATKSLNPKPFLVITDKALYQWMDSHIDKDQFSKKELKTIHGRLKTFAPSAIAQHPIDHNYYILSTQGKSLVVVNANNEIDQIYLLDHKIQRQPEGLCFDTNGDLYISNEGRGLVARIFRFEML